MMMHLETKHRQAFQRLQEAQSSLTSFQQSKARIDLKTAGAKLDEALNLDPNYLRAFYYRGLVRDMLGEAEQAARDFSLVLEQHPPFLSEVRYNLGVATFHQYGHTNLKLAVTHFEDVIKSTNKPALRLRASAFLAHAYAVMMIPRPAEKTDDCRKLNEFLASAEARKHVSRYHELSVDRSTALESELESEKDLDSSTRDEIRWRLRNTLAVQRMFYTDYFETERIEKLLQAEQVLLEADTINPSNWSIYCNLGSTYMRLAHWLKVYNEKATEDSEAYFAKALTRLDKVMADLIPNYSFAIYEKGRVYRLWGKFDEAKTWLHRALEVNENQTVSPTTIKCELERAELGSTDYPFLRADPSEYPAR
jgi:tetratricopeptide (TPR) repeat protein